MIAIPQVGNGGLTETENLAHFSMWCMLAAPLLAGNDITTMTPYVKSVLTHEELIAIDQDPLVAQAVVAKQGGRNISKLDQGWQVWKRPLHDGSTAALLLNRGGSNLSITAEFSDLGISGSAKIRDVWARKDLKTSDTSFTAVVPAHGSLTLKLTPIATAGVRVCDSVSSTKQDGRFTRPYIQLDCAVGKRIVSIDIVVANDDLADWHCGNEAIVANKIMVEEVRAVCVGKRSCRVRLGERDAMAVEGTCS